MDDRALRNLLERLRAGEASVDEAIAALGPAAGDPAGLGVRIRSLEAAAEQAEKMAGLGRLAAGIVHELANPLTAVTMYADALLEKWTLARGDEADLEKLRAVRDAGQRIQRLTRDLTAYARPGGGAAEPVDLAPLLEQAVRMCAPALREAGATVARALAPVPPVLGTRAALAQVAVNLIANAAQALPGSGTIRLGLAAAEGRVILTVADDGAGMTPEVRARCFEPFFTTRPGKGIGLGLATARGIVERHRGAISVESAPGRGTTVTVSLPIAQPRESTA